MSRLAGEVLAEEVRQLFEWNEFHPVVWCRMRQCMLQPASSTRAGECFAPALSGLSYQECSLAYVISCKLEWIRDWPILPVIQIC
jgi:hypothetical protein